MSRRGVSLWEVFAEGLNPLRPPSKVTGTPGTCGSTFLSCVCSLNGKHKRLDHVCSCGGSWKDDGTIVTYPNLYG